MAPCQCLSVISRCSIKRDERINLVLALGLLSTNPTLCFEEIQVSTKIKGTSLWDFFSKLGTYKILSRHGPSIVERAINLA